jgi:DivIVA domain-containing protein
MAAEDLRAGAVADQRREMQKRITKIRSASFDSVRKGYDPAQVKRFLDAVADWLEGLGLGDADRGEMRRELAWVGERTSEILTKAEETASELREQGQSEAQMLVTEARTASERMRAEADEESRRVRADAAAEAEETLTAAERKAAALVEEASRRRQDLNAVIADLLERRDEIVADGVRLADELTDLFSTTVDAPELEDDEGSDDDGAEDEGDEPQETRRFDRSALEETGDEYDEDGVRIPRDDDAPEPMRMDAGDGPDSEEQASQRR